MTKKDLLAAFVIGEVCSIIFLLVSNFLGLPDLVVKISKFFPVVLPLLSIAGIWLVSLLGKKEPTVFQIGKSFLVGILNTFIDLGILNLLIWISGFSSGWMYTLFKGTSFSVSVVNSYFWNKFWSFEKKSKTELKEFGQFFSITLGGLLIHLVIGSLVVNVIGPHFGLSSEIWANVGGIAAALTGFLWNFFGYKLIVFKK
jgi:putative flippase GtrA